MPDQQEQTVVIRKRQQIAAANRTMFIWVAAASVIVGAAAVGIVFLAQLAWFNERVLAEKTTTASTLDKNLKVIDELKNQVRLMNTNQALRDSMWQGETQPIQVVLDALPSDANSSALGASLQKKLLDDPALVLESIRLDPVAGVESGSDSAVEDASDSGSSSENAIHFSFTVSVAANDVNALKSMLQRLERSVRAIDVTALTIEAQGNRIGVSVAGDAFYEPAKTVELKDKVIKK
jgi:hypothetical protein